MKDKTVIISDLHIDTWKADKKVLGKTKLEHFYNFLEWIEPFTERLVINGDLLEAPPQGGEDILPTHYELTSRLLDLSNTVKIYYFVGNHDISFWGLKVRDFHNINIHYPRYPKVYLDFGPPDNKSYIYFEHGHFYDPVLSLYLFNTMKSLKPVGIFQRLKRLFYKIFKPAEIKKLQAKKGIDAGTLNKAVIRASQKRDPDTGAKILPLGYHELESFWSKAKTLAWKIFTPFVNKYLKPFAWTDAAQEVFENFCTEHPKMNIIAIIFGHTHLPDEAEITYKNKKALYLNSGDWAEPSLEKDPDTHHSSFIVVDKNGEFERDARGKVVREFITESLERSSLKKEPLHV